MAGDSSRSVVHSCSKGTPVPYCSLVCFVGRFVFSNFSVSGWSGKGALASSLAHGSHESSESKTRRRTVNLHLAAEWYGVRPRQFREGRMAPRAVY